MLLQLWHLADRWGRVTRDGTVLPLTLTHDLLGHLTAFRRSTVTLAIAALESDGVLVRLADGAWLLTREAEQRVAAIAHASKTTASSAGRTCSANAWPPRRESQALRAEAEQICAYKRTAGKR